jgi:hypothetical protein
LICCEPYPAGSDPLWLQAAYYIRSYHTAFIFLAGKASDNKYSMIKREPVAAEARYEKTTILLETN